MTGANYRLGLSGGAREISLTRDELLALPQRTATLPIACVEGWTTTQEWTGVALAELAAGRRPRARLCVRALAPAGRVRARRRSTRAGHRSRCDARPEGQRRRPLTGSRLPGAHHRAGPSGVHNTKWVASIEFARA
jgi:hypothetical protein